MTVKNLWDRKKNIVYIKVGSFFLGALIIVFITLISLKEVNIFKGTYEVTVTFDFAEGLANASPVRFCGVDVGEVRTVVVKEIGDKPLVFVYAKIEKGVNIPKDSYFFVNSLSLFGEKYLEIDPPQKVTAYIQEGDIVEGISPVPLFDIFASASKTMNEVRAFLREGEIKQSVANIVNNIEDVTLEVKGLLEDMKDKQGTIGRLLYDDSLYQTTEEFIGDLKAHPWKLLHKPKDRKKRK
ncbi:MAG: MlaD family protein [Candidatus Omnitrophica bacterium]|nr:MlaD family protein [Candidatus Omnitrophota bacterium]